MEDFSNYWVLRRGDLHAEQVKDVGPNFKACKILKKEGLLFLTKEQAEAVRKVMLDAVGIVSQ